MIGQLSKEEVNRKLLHVLAVVLPCGIFYTPIHLEIHRSYAFLIIFSIFVFSVFVEIFRMRVSVFSKWFSDSFSSMMRAEEKNQLTGATYVVGGSVICSLISLHSEKAAVCAFLCLTLFILGDAAAAVIGKAVGRIKVGQKTVEGALGCFLLCAFIAGLIFPSLPYFKEFWGGEISFFQIIFISALVSILEFFPIRWNKFVLNDNLYVPGITSLVAIIIN